MSAKGFFKGLAGRKADGDDGHDGGVAIIRQSDQSGRIGILDDFEAGGFAWLWASDAQGHLIYISPGAADGLECDHADLLGKQLTELFELDPDNPDERSDRPLKFQLSARSRSAI